MAVPVNHGPIMQGERHLDAYCQSRCLECPEILREDYGGCGRLTCVRCIADDEKRENRFARERAKKHT